MSCNGCTAMGVGTNSPDTAPLQLEQMSCHAECGPACINEGNVRITSS